MKQLRNKYTHTGRINQKWKKGDRRNKILLSFILFRDLAGTLLSSTVFSFSLNEQVPIAAL
jgi:hypothetical protein